MSFFDKYPTRAWREREASKEGEEYPRWICQECANSRGHHNLCLVSSYCMATCGWCDKNKPVTQPRDYGYPPFSKNK